MMELTFDQLNVNVCLIIGLMLHLNYDKIDECSIERNLVVVEFIT